jgi:uncharacterized membrane protein
MTDAWSQSAERASAPEHAPDSAPPVGASSTELSPSWQPYATPQLAPAAPADPLIMELEHGGPIAQPAHLEAAPSVYGRVEPDLEPLELTHLEAAPPEPPQAPVPVAQAEKPVEIAAQAADPVIASAPAVAEPPVAASVVAPIAVAPALAVEPPSARPIMTEAPIAPSAAQSASLPADHGHDAVLAGFDHVVALAGYVLLFVSVFMFGVPALATVALAYAHKNDAHLLVRSHYRFQLRVFWTAVLFGVLALGAAITAGGLAVGKLIDFVHAHLPGVDTVMDRANVGSWSGEIAGILVIAAVTLGVLAVIWTLVASVFGFLRLLANRPIGHQFVGK